MVEAIQKVEAASQLTLLKIPPRPQTLVETPTSQALAAQKENPQITHETLTQEIPPTGSNSPDRDLTISETLEGEGKETHTREGQVGDDVSSTGAGKGEEKSMLEEEDDRKGEEAETAENMKSEGEEVEKNEEREVAEGSGAEEADGNMYEGEEVEGDMDDEADGSGKFSEEGGNRGDERKGTGGSWMMSRRKIRR